MASQTQSSGYARRVARLLVVHPARSALEHEALAEALAAWAHAHEFVLACGEPALAWLEHELARCEGVVLVEPARWWLRSLEERLRRPWLAWIERHVELDRHARLGGVAYLARQKARSEALARAHWLGAAGLAGVDAWLAGRVTGPRALELPALAETTIDRPEARAAIEAALARSRQVALVGPAGSGKTTLLHAWVAAARAEGCSVALHVVTPELGSTRRRTWILANLARQLDGDARDFADALARAERASPRRAVVLVVDGLELVDEVAALLAALPGGARAQWLLGCRPGARPDTASVVSLVPDAALLDALVARVGRVDAGDLAALRERAGGSPAYLAAMIDESASRTAKQELREMTRAATDEALPRLPRRFAAELGRMLGHVAALPLARRRQLERVLDLLALFEGSAPLAILQAALELGPVPELLAAAAGALVLEPGSTPRLSLVHAGLTEQLRAQLDDRAALERGLRGALERLSTRTKLDGESQAFVDAWLPKLCRQEGRPSGKLADVEHLQALIRQGGVAALEQVLLPFVEGLGADMRAIVGRHQAALTRDATALAGLLWHGLRAAGHAASELLDALRWVGEGPCVRLEHPLAQPDMRARTLPHPEAAHACAIDAAGTRVLSGCADGRLRLWSREAGALLVELDCGRSIRACALSPDARWAIAGTTDGTVSRWDLVTRERTHVTELGDEWVRSLAIDAAARLVLIGDDAGRVWLWRVGERLRELGSHGERIAGVALQADMGVSAGGKQVHAWDLATGKRIGSSPKHEYILNALAIARTGKHAYVCGIGASWVLGLPSCSIEHVVEHKLPVASACVALGRPDVVVVAHEGRLERWAMREGELELRRWLHAADIEMVAVSADDRWWASAGGLDVVVSRVEPEPARVQLAEPLSRTAVAVNPSGTQAAVGVGIGVEIVDLASGETLATLDTSRANALAWIDDDRVLIGGASNHELSIWSTRTRSLACKRAPGSDWLRGLAIAPDRRQALAVGDDKRTWLVDLDDLAVETLGKHPDWVHACAFVRTSAGELALAADGDAELRAWRRDSGTLEFEGKSDKNHAYAALVATSTHAFAGGSAGAIDVWALPEGRLLAPVEAHADKLVALALADEDRVLVSAAADGEIKLWRVGPSLRLLDRVIGHAPFLGLCVAGSRIVAIDEAGNLWSLCVDWRRLAAVAG